MIPPSLRDRLGSPGHAGVAAVVVVRRGGGRRERSIPVSGTAGVGRVRPGPRPPKRDRLLPEAGAEEESKRGELNRRYEGGQAI